MKIDLSIDEWEMIWEYLGVYNADEAIKLRTKITYSLSSELMKENGRPKPVPHNPFEPSPMDEGKKPPRHGVGPKL